jgi:TolB-like protein/tetratricopeptide (TPR) repeat protein
MHFGSIRRESDAGTSDSAIRAQSQFAFAEFARKVRRGGLRMADVFISYKAEDRPRVRPLVDALEAEGLLVWWDEQVGGGEAWRESIEQQLDAAACVIVVWSKRSTGPEGRFVRDEANRAARRRTYLPVRIDKVEPPLGFGEMQALDLNGWKGDRSDPRYHAVSGCVHSMLGKKGPGIGRAAPRGRVSRRAVLAGGGVAAAAAAGGGWLLLRPAGAKANTVAVLPFENLSGDPAQSYFSDGIAEELRNALSALGGLQVVARTSSEMLRNSDAITAAKRLSVASVVTGSVRRSPSTVRVNAQLVDGSSGLERWSQSFDRPFGDVLQIQSDIATNVAQALSTELGSRARVSQSLGGTNNPAAQDYLLQAVATDGDDSDAAMRRRITLLEQATRLDPTYAEAHARKGFNQDIWASTYARNSDEKDRIEAQAIQSVKRAIAIAPNMALGHSALGLIYSNQLLMNRAISELEQAAELSGADAGTFLNAAIVLSQVGRQSEGESRIARAISLDPINPNAHWVQSWILLFGRRYPAALAAARQTLAIAPGNIRARTLAGWSLIMLGRADEALRELQKTPADDYRRLVGEGIIAARSGRRADALGAIQGIGKRYGDAANYQFAQVYAQLGMTDRAIQALEAAWSKRDSGLGSIRVDPFLDPLRNDPRFSSIAARLFI